MSNAHHSETKTEAAKPGAPLPRKIHRVCISCNYMFEVTPENFAAKHCPKCHKG
ncbi:MAG: hypothetical protein HY234_13805 [Acidobacteria bacterium]|nr:hypothetical protein [Acidobacteriota bacterium]